MPADRVTPTSHAESLNDTLAQLRDGARTARAALGRLSLEGWLAVACAIVVMWALGWFYAWGNPWFPHEPPPLGGGPGCWCRCGENAVSPPRRRARSSIMRSRLRPPRESRRNSEDRPGHEPPGTWKTPARSA
jgi:hypothetical protein